MNTNFLLVASFMLIVSSACNQTYPSPQALETPIPLSLPPTWTPSPTQTSRPVSTDAPIETYTPVPALNPLAYSSLESITQVLQQIHKTLYSPDNNWIAYQEQNGIRLINPQTEKVWTLPCELFDRCDKLFPISWSGDSQFLYFAPAISNMGIKVGISSFTAVGRIDVKSGDWEKLLSDTDNYYDFSVSINNEYLAYTQSADTHSVALTILNLKPRTRQIFTLEGDNGGNIVWSPFKSRFVFQIQNTTKGSSIVYFDADANLLRYIVTDEKSDFHIFYWDENNLLQLRKEAWSNRLNSDWTLNPFTNELSPISTAIP